MAALTTVEIARMWAAALSKDRTLRHWAENYYHRPFAITIGADMRRPPDENDTPFIALFPDSMDAPTGRAHNLHDMGLIVGIADDEWINSSGIKEMQGLNRLDALFPLLQKTLDFSLIGANAIQYTVEYELVQFPLLMLLISITVDESLPIGKH